MINEGKKFKNTKGITLIALVVTIIILIILAAISIATISGQNGTLSKAGEAVTRKQIGTAQDKCALIASDVVTDYYYNVYIEGGGAYSSSSLDELILDEICSSDEITDLGITVEDTSDGTDTSFTLTYTDGTSVTGTISNGKITWGTVQMASSEVEKVTIGIASEIVTAENYGDYINYLIDLNGDGDTTNDWKIFYNDGDYVFIIAADYLKNSLVPSDLGAITKGDYIVYWDSPLVNNLDNAQSRFMFDAMSNAVGGSGDFYVAARFVRCNFVG